MDGSWQASAAWPSPPPQQTPESFGDKNRSYRARSFARSIEIWRITADISFILRGHPSLAHSHRLDDCRKRLGGQRIG